MVFQCPYNFGVIRHWQPVLLTYKMPLITSRKLLAGLPGPPGIFLASGNSGLISSHYAIAFMTVIFVLYGVAGGLSAAIITDLIQGLLTIIFSFLLLPLILNAIGGFEGMRQEIQDSQMLSLVAPAEIGFFYIVGDAFDCRDFK